MHRTRPTRARVESVTYTTRGFLGGFLGLAFLRSVVLRPMPASTAAAAQPAAAGPPECAHRFLELWGEEWHCGTCKVHVTDPEQTANEDANAKNAEEEDRASFGGDPNKAAEGSFRRAVTVEWLVAFTERHQCWEWPTWRLKEDVIKPATQASRCRFADLPDMAGVIGPADVFASHCWGAPWGDLVAALSDCARPSRRAWIDVFAVRQWPGNGADLDFRGVVQRCPVMMLCCTSMDLLSDTDSSESDNSDDDWAVVPEEITDVSDANRKNIAFCRVWCLVEIGAAQMHGVPVVMKGGQAAAVAGSLPAEERRELNLIPGSGGRRFISNGEMLAILQMLVDVTQAEATNPADKAWILDEVERMDGGAQAMNALVTQAIRGASACMELPAVQAAACGELEALALDSSDDVTKGEALLGACAAGYVIVVRTLLEAGAPLEATVAAGQAGSPGCTPLHLAVDSGHLTVVGMLLDAGADISSEGDRCEVHTMGSSGCTGDGQPPLMRAVVAGEQSMVALLIQRGADPNQPIADWRGEPEAGTTPLMVALRKQQQQQFHHQQARVQAARSAIVDILRDAGANDTSAIATAEEGQPPEPA
eukprot:COSAG02_NODE_817_length_16825_cov_49.127646_17_plen_593_part_00